MHVAPDPKGTCHVNVASECLDEENGFIFSGSSLKKS